MARKVMLAAALGLGLTVGSAAGAGRPRHALLGLDQRRQGDDAHRAGPELSGDLALRPRRPADPGGRDLSELAQGQRPGRDHRLDAPAPAQRQADRPRHRRRSRGRCTRIRREDSKVRYLAEPGVVGRVSKCAGRLVPARCAGPPGLYPAATYSGASTPATPWIRQRQSGVEPGRFRRLRSGKPFELVLQRRQRCRSSSQRLRTLPRSMREAGAFRLEWRGPAEPVLAQAIYRFRRGERAVRHVHRSRSRRTATARATRRCSTSRLRTRPSRLPAATPSDRRRRARRSWRSRGAGRAASPDCSSRHGW